MGTFGDLRSFRRKFKEIPSAPVVTRTANVKHEDEESDDNNEDDGEGMEVQQIDIIHLPETTTQSFPNSPKLLPKIRRSLHSQPCSSIGEEDERRTSNRVQMM